MRRRCRRPAVPLKAARREPAGRLFLVARRKRHERTRELGELSRRARGERNEKAPVRVGPTVAVGISVGVGGGILNLGGSIDFTIWTPPKVKNKPSRTYSTLIECLSSARLVSTHRLPEREKKRERNRAG